MRGRTFRVKWREEDSVEELKKAYLKEHYVVVRTRLHGLSLLRSGWRWPVAAAVGVGYRAVQRWVEWYPVGGVPAVRAHGKGGKGQKAFLAEEAQAQVAEEIATGRFRTAGEIRDWIAEQYGPVYTVGGVYSLLIRLRCAPKVPRPRHVQTDPEQQAAWKKGGSNRRSLRSA